ncbi:Putative uncharacterized protein [Halomonas sp. R57-5]|nr:Putative uncharacterized protein [Halomonas sp. R57-5]
MAERLGKVLSHAAALATDNPKKKAKVSIDLTVENIGSGARVGVTHKLAFKIPTEHGTQSEEHTTETVMCVNTGGHGKVSRPAPPLSWAIQNRGSERLYCLRGGSPE